MQDDAEGRPDDRDRSEQYEKDALALAQQLVDALDGRHGITTMLALIDAAAYVSAVECKKAGAGAEQQNDVLGTLIRRLSDRFHEMSRQ